MARIVWDTGIHKLLSLRYPAPAWAIFFEVASGVGRGGGRYADALAMSLFPSRGLDFHGFEIKHNRKDWLSELKRPEKADRIASYCDFWWLVLGNEGIAKKEEIPSTWGVLVDEDGQLVQKKAPKRLKSRAPDRFFIAALLRRANEMAERAERRMEDEFSSKKAVQKAYDQGVKKGEQDAREDADIAHREHEALKRNLADFEHASGIKIDMWNGGRIGEAVERLRGLKKSTAAEELDQAAETLERAAQELRDKSESLKKAPSQIPPRSNPILEPEPSDRLSP